MDGTQDPDDCFATMCFLVGQLVESAQGLRDRTDTLGLLDIYNASRNAASRKHVTFPSKLKCRGRRALFKTNVVVEPPFGYLPRLPLRDQRRTAEDAFQAAAAADALDPPPPSPPPMPAVDYNYSEDAMEVDEKPVQGPFVVVELDSDEDVDVHRAGSEVVELEPEPREYGGADTGSEAGDAAVDLYTAAVDLYMDSTDFTNDNDYGVGVQITGDDPDEEEEEEEAPVEAEAKAEAKDDDVASSPQNEDNSSQSQFCPICREHYAPSEPPTTLPCGHAFHAGCLARAFDRRQSGPFLCGWCRRPLRHGRPGCLHRPISSELAALLRAGQRMAPGSLRCTWCVQVGEHLFDSAVLDGAAVAFFALVMAYPSALRGVRADAGAYLFGARPRRQRREVQRNLRRLGLLRRLVSRPDSAPARHVGDPEETPAHVAAAEMARQACVVARHWLQEALVAGEVYNARGELRLVVRQWQIERRPDLDVKDFAYWMWRALLETYRPEYDPLMLQPRSEIKTGVRQVEWEEIVSEAQVTRILKLIFRYMNAMEEGGRSVFDRVLVLFARYGFFGPYNEVEQDIARALADIEMGRVPQASEAHG
ncbi:hypothetical protein GGR56DRAFT_687119 [Xylariaceae sp. FL0804]|nr:hypothetical protein GGR56DRAFT_687119 [Xylariaceae sp. FL0804]